MFLVKCFLCPSVYEYEFKDGENKVESNCPKCGHINVREKLTNEKVTEIKRMLEEVRQNSLIIEQEISLLKNCNQFLREKSMFVDSILNRFIIE